MADNTPIQPPPPDESVNVINPHGELVSLPPNQAQQALSNPQSGYKPATPEIVQDYKDKQEFGGGAQQVIAGLEGVAQGIAGPIAPAVEEGLGLTTGKRILAREEQNPGTHYLTQGLGLGISNVIPGFGEARDAMAAADAAKAAVKAGTMTVDAAKPILEAGAKAINPLSAQSILTGGAERAASKVGFEFGKEGVANEAAKGAFKLAFESGALQLGDETSHLIEGDPHQSLQSAAMNIGTAATIAAPLGGLFGAAHPLWKATAGKTLGQTAEDFKARMKFNLDHPEPAAAMKEELENHVRSSDSVFNEVYGANGLKADAIEKLMPNQMSDLMVGQATDTAQAGKHFLDEMRRNPDLFPGNLRARYERDFNILSESLQSPQTPGEVFNALQEFKQRLQSYQPKGFISSVDPSHDFLKGASSLSKELRLGLEDPEVWGEAGNVQQDINKAFSQYLPAQKQFRGKFMSPLGDGFVVDEGKVQGYLNQAGKAGQKLKQSMLGNFLQADQKYRNAVESTFAKQGLESPFPPSSTQLAQQTLEKQTAGAKLADFVYNKGLSEVAGEAAGAGVGAAVGSAVGHPIFGAYLGERALGHFFKSILPILAKPLYHGAASGEGLKAAIDYGLAVTNAQKLMSKAAEGVFRAGQEVVPTALIPSKKDLEKLEQTVQKAQLDPSKLLEKGGALGNYMEDHASAHGSFTAAVVNKVGALKPYARQSAPLDTKAEPNQTQKAKYNRALEIIQQPLMILQHIKNGTLTADDISNFKSTHAALYPAFVKNLTSEMVKKVSDGEMIPYHTRMSLSLFMGQPLDSTMTPMAIQLSQPVVTQAPPPQKSNAGLNKMSASYQTPGQAAESKRVMK